MNREDLMKAMNGIDDSLLEDSRQEVPQAKRSHAWRTGLIAAAVVACLAITAVAVAPKHLWLTTDREEAYAYMEQQVSEYGNGYLFDMSSIENEKLTGEEAAQVSQKSLDRNLDYVLRDEDNEILSDKTDGETWTRKIEYATSGHPGAFYIADDVTTLLKNDARFDADFSYLEQVGTPVEGSIWLKRYFSPYLPEEDIWTEVATFNATYRTPSGGAIQLGISADEALIYRTAPVYCANFAFEDTVKSADGVEFTIFGLPSGRIFAETFNGHASMLIIAFDCPREEVEDIINHCSVAQMLENLSTLGGN